MLLLCSCASHTPKVSPYWESVDLPVNRWFEILDKNYDTDGDKKITIHDRPQELVLDKEVTIQGAYPISIVMQRLALAQEKGKDTITLKRSELVENPVDRTSRMIKEYYWKGLTRSIDAKGLAKILQDSKAEVGQSFYIYVPHADKKAYNYFQHVAQQQKNYKLKVVRLPSKISPYYVRKLDGKHGILSLQLETDRKGVRGTPFVVPGGRFNEMYGWDSYFIILGLLEDGEIGLAKSMVENLTYQIRNYGKILNANRSYYLTRSQPPFTTSAINAVYKHLPQNSVNRGWYRNQMMWALQEYKSVWMSKPRLTETGLSRYYGEGIGPCPEVEKGHYDHILYSYAKKEEKSPQEYYQHLMQQLRENKKFKMPEKLATFFTHDRAIRESGHDTTYRFDNRTSDFLPVDLNSLLAKTESDFAEAVGRKELSAKQFGSAKSWQDRWEKRKKLMLQYFWDENSDAFYDYDLKNFARSKYQSATSLYPLWAKIIDPAMAKDLVKSLLPKLEEDGGVASSSRQSRGAIGPYRPERQWDYPYGWAPHQILIWEGLANYQMEDVKDRLISKWLTMITKNARDYNGVVPEKYDVVKRTHLVFAEYGNVGVDFSYITQEGFGWMNASYQLGLKMLGEKSLQSLKEKFE